MEQALADYLDALPAAERRALAGPYARALRGPPMVFVPQQQRAVTTAAPSAVYTPSAPRQVALRAAAARMLVQPQRYFSPGAIIPGTPSDPSIPDPTLSPGPSSLPAPDGTVPMDTSMPVALPSPYGSGGGVPTRSAPAPSEQQPANCPPGAAFDITVNTCVCGAGLVASADGSACIAAGRLSAGGGDGSSAFGWFALLVGAVIMVRAVS